MLEIESAKKRPANARTMPGGEPKSGTPVRRRDRAHFVAPNPPFGAVVTYYLKEDLKTRKAARQKQEKAALEAEEAVAFPGWQAVEQERREPEPNLWLIVRDAEGRVVRRISGPTRAGFHRVAWDRLPDAERGRAHRAAAAGLG